MTFSFEEDNTEGLDDLMKRMEEKFYLGKTDPNYKSAQEYLKDYEEFN